MKIETSEQGDIAILAFEGELETNTSQEAQDSITHLIDQGKRKLVIDFTRLDFISSAGLRVLLATAKRLGGSGGELRVCGLNDVVQEVFDISGFATLLNVCETREEAQKGF